jgi:hypothetical protein
MQEQCKFGIKSILESVNFELLVKKCTTYLNFLKEIRRYVKESRNSLADLGCEMLCEYLHDSVLPKLLYVESKTQNDCEGYTDAMKQYLCSIGLAKFIKEF